MHGDDPRSVRQPSAHGMVERSPSTPPVSGPFACAVKLVLPLVSAAIAMPLPAAPIVREQIVKVSPSALARAPSRAAAEVDIPALPPPPPRPPPGAGGFGRNSHPPPPPPPRARNET